LTLPPYEFRTKLDFLISPQTVRRPFDATRSTHLGVVPLLVGFHSGDCLGGEQNQIDQEHLIGRSFCGETISEIINTFSLQLFGEQRAAKCF